MKKKYRDEEAGADSCVNHISKKTNGIMNVILTVMALACVLPVLLVIIVSFSSEQSIFENGYTFFVRSLYAAQCDYASRSGKIRGRNESRSAQGTAALYCPAGILRERFAGIHS